MKTRFISLIIILLAFGLFSCEKGPLAGFTVPYSTVEVDEIIDFHNTSLRSNDFEWDFGDGYYSTKHNPSHSYSDPGTYEVSLKAYSNSSDMMDVVYLTVYVLEQTSLEITVMEWDTDNVIPDVEITLFTSIRDWEDEENGEFIGLTGGNGRIFIEGLDPIRYYIDAWNTDYNNYTLATEDVGFIETDILEANTVNYFIAEVDYDPGVKSKSDSKNSGSKNLKDKV
ncbi:PKD domain-containing protein [Bacteroidota bacterium]